MDSNDFRRHATSHRLDWKHSKVTLIVICLLIVTASVCIPLGVKRAQMDGGFGNAQFIVGTLALGLLFILYFLCVYTNKSNTASVFEDAWGRYFGYNDKEGINFKHPFVGRTVVDTRIHNSITSEMKIQDKENNPVVVSANYAWRINHPGKAEYKTENVDLSTRLICENEIRRQLLSKSFANIRDIDFKKSQNVKDALGEIGVEVIDFNLNNVSYAPEIAVAMLQKNQAKALLDAKEILSDGVVDIANKISERVPLSSQQMRDSLVKNAIIVLLGNDPAQPVIPIT